MRIGSGRKTMKDAQGGSVFDELLSFCYHVADREERSDRDTPANFGTPPRRAGVLRDAIMRIHSFSSLCFYILPNKTSR